MNAPNQQYATIWEALTPEQRNVIIKADEAAKRATQEAVEAAQGARGQQGGGQVGAAAVELAKAIGEVFKGNAPAGAQAASQGPVNARGPVSEAFTVEQNRAAFDGHHVLGPYAVPTALLTRYWEHGQHIPLEYFSDQNLEAALDPSSSTFALLSTNVRIPLPPKEDTSLADFGPLIERLERFVALATLEAYFKADDPAKQEAKALERRDAGNCWRKLRNTIKSKWDENNTPLSRRTVVFYLDLVLRANSTPGLKGFNPGAFDERMYERARTLASDAIQSEERDKIVTLLGGKIADLERRLAVPSFSPSSSSASAPYSGGKQAKEGKEGTKPYEKKDGGKGEKGFRGCIACGKTGHSGWKCDWDDRKVFAVDGKLVFVSITLISSGRRVFGA